MIFALRLVLLSAAAALAATGGAAHAAPGDGKRAKAEARTSPAPRALAGFTPSAGSSGAALAAGAATELRAFRFTPAGRAASDRAVTLGLRARPLGAVGLRRGADDAAGFDLGVAVGARGLALTGSASRVDLGISARESVSVGLGLARRNWGAKLSVGEETEALRGADRLGADKRYTAEIGGNFRLTRNLQLGAGVRYRMTPEAESAGAKARAAEDRAAFLGVGVSF